MGCLCQEQQQVLQLSICLLKVDHLGKIKLEEGRGQKESRKTSDSKMKRFKDSVRVGEGSRESGGEVRSTEKREQRRQSMTCRAPHRGGCLALGAQHALSPQESSLQRFRSSA